ncbi:MAG: response regulator [Ferruginibacter sp.]
MLSQKTILLIDDDSDDQEIFSNALKRSDKSVKCVFANDGIHALEKINAEKEFVPDFIFIDLNMPRMNGQECLVNIKKIDKLKNVPVYIYSTSMDPLTIAANKKLGANDFIVKPASMMELTAVLSKLLKRPAVFLSMAMMLLAAIPQKIFAQKTTLPPVSKLKKLSVEQLMNIEVTSVSKTPQKLAEVASAIQVLTGDDIKRSPTTLMPEVLRLAPNLQVTRAGAHDWAVTARGFNGAPISNSSLADKLLVTIDGRAVYNPLFGGVYWDVQGVMKDDIDRIEVVSGPGGTLWGANAVNGVINVISKNAKETQGFTASAAYGTFLKDGFTLRYGSHIDSTFYFRIFGNRFDFNSSNYKNGLSADDKWNMTKGGFRMDYTPKGKSSFTLQGDLYTGNEDVGDSTQINGQNLLGRWKYNISQNAGLTFQAYFDRTWRNAKPDHLTDEVKTLDFDLQYNFRIARFNRILLGIGYRNLSDSTNSGISRFTPAFRTLQLLSGFLQDQITLIPKRLELTIGSKFLHNDYTHFEWQPSARLAWTVTEKNTLWTAVSRAVRVPSRFDRDLTSIQDLDYPPVTSERVIAYELGYRTRPAENVSISVATFYNNYDDLRSIDSTTFINRRVLGNNLKANSWGLEFSANYIATKWWRLRGGFTYMNKKFTYLTTRTIPDDDKFEAIDPKFTATLQSIMDLPKNFEFDIVARYVSKLEGSASRVIPDIPAYFSLDARINWTYKNISLGLSAQNLTDDSHPEFGSPRIEPRELPRSIHAKIGFHF